jgi:hypothetical protein
VVTPSQEYIANCVMSPFIYILTCMRMSTVRPCTRIVTLNGYQVSTTILLPPLENVNLQRKAPTVARPFPIRRRWLCSHYLKVLHG